MYRTQYHRCKRYAQVWASVQAEVYGCPVSRLMLTRWVGRCHRANLVGGSPSGWRGGLFIDLTRTPADVAAETAMSPSKLNQHIRSCSAALWLCWFVARPERIGMLGREYHPEDCRNVMHDVGQMLRDAGLYRWVYQYLCNLLFLYAETHEAPHAGEKLAEQIDRLQTAHGIPCAR